MNKHEQKKEILLYLMFGGLTTLVNVMAYYVLSVQGDMDYKIATTAAWIASVLFAFITNKKYVFQSTQSGLKEIGTFFMSRSLSYLLDIGTMIILIDVFTVNDMVSKILANALVVIFNYIASKYFVFIDNSDHSGEGSKK